MASAMVTTIILILVAGTVWTSRMYAYHSSLDRYSEEEAFLAYFNIPIQKCIEECQVRSACMAVNYWRQRRNCEMLTTDAGLHVQQNFSEVFSTFLRKSDIQPLIVMDMAACANCNVSTACDISSSSCALKECRRLQIENGTVYGNILSVGSKVKIVCDEWFTLNPAEPKSTCQSDGSWSSVPVCTQADCGTPPTVMYASVSTGNTLAGTMRTYTCLGGYAARNIMTMNTTCQANGTWSAFSFDCVFDCGSPPTVPYATISIGDTTESTIRTYACMTGFVIQNLVSMSTTCVLGSGWSSPSFDCVWDCGSPPTVPYATISTGDNTEGITRTFTCMTGYVFRNLVSMSTICVLGSGWSTPLFDCVWDCGEPPAVTYATKSGGDTVTGMVWTYTCDSGYEATGSESVTCQTGGTWTAGPTCTVKPCPDNWFQLGSSCYFTPGSGFGFERNFFAAKDYCVGIGGYLLQLETPAEAAAVESYIYSNYGEVTVWLGITDNGTEGTWYWIEGNVEATWLEWNTGQPNGGIEHNYIRLREDGVWGDIIWSQNRQPMCEKSAVVP